MRDPGAGEFEATAGGDAEDTNPSAPFFEDFEQRRLLASARQRLFGRAPTLSIGRYRVERRLGSGGMGEVYLAIDESLQRKVAVKRVRAGLISDRREQRRLQREAQALARLSHPNVVQVYEIGEHEGQTFIAMECVEGSTLATWLSAEPRSWESILERFVAAGRGLAAAHGVGLIHRDFKAENVLIGESGVLRVADFGLVLAADPRDFAGQGQGQGEGESKSGAVSGELTLTRVTDASGAIMGTLRYMPGEQLRGEPVDARSDQFSFCVALYEALWEVPPFALESVPARLEGLESGPRPPPRSPVPTRLWTILRRGLAPARTDRWPDMDTLLAALEHVPRQRRLARWIGVTTLAVASVAGVLALSHAPADPCAGLASELGGVWDGERRAELEARHFETLAHVEESRGRVLAALDQWAAAWVEEQGQVCRARVDHSAPASLIDARERCLTRERARVEALVAVLAEGDADTLARAVEALVQLPTPESCASELALLGVEAPAAPIAEAVADARAQLERAHELRLLGRVDEGRALALQTQAAALELDYAPLIAEASAEVGKAELSAGSLARGVEALRVAVDLAEANHHDVLAADLWTELALRSLVDLDDVEAGARDLRRAEVASTRAPGTSTRRAARQAFAAAQLADARGDAEAAEDALREALALVDDAGGSADADRPSYEISLAQLIERRDPARALEIYRQALASAERRYGPAHPRSADASHQLGEALLRRGEVEAAEASLGRAVAIWIETHDRPHRQLARAERSLAQLALRRGEFDAAQAHALAQARVQAEVLPPGHAELGDPELLLAIIAGAQGNRAAALAHCEAALMIWEPTLAVTDGRLSRARSEAASHLLALGRVDEAARMYGGVVEHAAPTEVVAARIGLAEIALRGGRPAEARTELRAIDTMLTAEPGALGGNALAHALLWALAQRRLGEPIAARVEALEAARVGSPISAAQIDAWLDELAVTGSERRALGF